MTRFDTSTSNPRMPRYRSHRSRMVDPPEPTTEARQRCAEAWRRAKQEIEEAIEATRVACKSKYTPAAPEYSAKEVDISDLPAANATPQELRAWEALQKDAAA